MEAKQLKHLHGWSKLSPVQQQFVRIYCETGDSKQAFLRAYNPKLKHKYQITDHAGRKMRSKKISAVIEQINNEFVKKAAKTIERNDPIDAAAEIRADMLQKLKKLADFNINRFIKNEVNGIPVYDFTGATDDDYWCLEALEIDIKAVNKEPITIIKPKLNNRLKAIELILKHTDVKGLDHGVEVNMTTDGYETIIQAIKDKHKGKSND